MKASKTLANLIDNYNWKNAAKVFVMWKHLVTMLGMKQASKLNVVGLTVPDRRSRK